MAAQARGGAARGFWRLSILAVALAVGVAVEAEAADPPRTPSADDPRGAILEVASGAELTPTAFIDRVLAVDVVVLGEVHDNAEHHAWQAWTIAEAEARRGAGGGVKGLAFEMIPQTSEAAVAAHFDRGGPVEALGAAIRWEARGWPDWALYAPIVAAAPTARITGGAFERDVLRGYAVDLSSWPLAEDYGLTTALAAEDQAAREAEQMAAHCDKLPVSRAPMMVGVQRLWDASFADAALRALDGPGDGVVALITGAQHARLDRGAPAAIALVRPEVSTLVVGFVETDETGAVDLDSFVGHFDLVVTTRAPERDDPCAAFAE